MMFESSKKKRLQEVRQRISLLRSIFEVRREHVMRLIGREIYTPEQIAMQIDSAYKLFIEKLEEIEDDIYI